ncbi:MAG: mandelate racemase/muconate lactonizing enzyme family protein [Trueperaceae bacterium]|nr:MAG: mandelate racemase/muconate lactonizing enzyme family protein [Trueperaceae bacterium]
MKITDVQAIYLSLPTISNRSDGTQDALLVRVTTDSGIVGVGEVDSSPLAAKAAIEAPMSNSITSGLRELVVGEDPFGYEYLWHKMYQASRYAGRRGLFIHAISGIDLALWDIIGRALDTPVTKLLGGGFRNRVRAYASTLFGPTLESTADRARWCVEQGYSAVKFGWDPMGQDSDHDEALVATIREAVGPKVDVLIDAGQCWDTKRAIQMARRFEPYDIYWLEEPLSPDNLAGYAELGRSTHLRIAAGEAESDRHSYVDLMDRGQIDVVQIDPTRTGGLTEARKIAWAAIDRGKAVINHSFTTDINIAASLALLASIPEAPFVEFCVEDSPLRTQLTLEPFVVEDGFVRVPEGPGLGVELNEATIERYAVRV